MSTTRKSIIFLAIAFAISWGITLGAHFSGLKDQLGPAGATAILVAMMTGPAIAAVICAFAFEKGRRVVDAAMHGAENRGLRRGREMLQLAAIGVIRVADAAGARESLDERRKIRRHVAAPGSGTGRLSRDPRAAPCRRGCRRDAPCR